MSSKGLIPVRAEETDYSKALKSQRQDAVVIEIKRDPAAYAATIKDYLDETVGGADYAFYLTSEAVTGRGNYDANGRGKPGDAVDTLDRIRDDRERKEEKVTDVPDYLTFLQEIAKRRALGATLIESTNIAEGSWFLSFIDHGENEIVRISMVALRASRRRAMVDDEYFQGFEDVAKGLGLADGDAAIASSKSPTTRAAILGVHEFSWTSNAGATFTAEELSAALGAPEIRGSFAVAVPEIGDPNDRTVELEDDRQ